MDRRCARLTDRSARSSHPVADGPESTREVYCCRCRGGIGFLHLEDQERPLPISQGRPEGWRLCTRCATTIETCTGGRRIYRHGSDRTGVQRAWLIIHSQGILLMVWCWSVNGALVVRGGRILRNARKRAIIAGRNTPVTCGECGAPTRGDAHACQCRRCFVLCLSVSCLTSHGEMCWEDNGESADRRSYLGRTTL